MLCSAGAAKASHVCQETPRGRISPAPWVCTAAPLPAIEVQVVTTSTVLILTQTTVASKGISSKLVSSDHRGRRCGPGRCRPTVAVLIVEGLPRGPYRRSLVRLW
jgi:hypothetical protein